MVVLNNDTIACEVCYESDLKSDVEIDPGLIIFARVSHSLCEYCGRGNDGNLPKGLPWQ